jgi:nucleoside-diphosphate-sugar epimerase
MDTARVLVTGCAGFIGSNIAERLVKEGHDVVGIDDLSTGKDANMKGIGLEFVRCSVNDEKAVKRLLDGVSCVFHQAAIPSVARSIEDPVGTNRANVEGTLNMLVWSRDCGVKRFVYASSSSVYGDSPKLPKTEVMPINPKSPYALSKYVGEAYCRLFHELYGFETVPLRYFNVFGPRQDPDSQYSAVIPKFIRAVLNSESPEIYGDGKQTRDFSYVDNVVDANMLSMRCPKSACGKAYNIACGERITVNRLLEIINGIKGTDIKARHTGERKGDIRHSLADISLAKRFLGYEPKVGLMEGLRKTVEWYEAVK